MHGKSIMEFPDWVQVKEKNTIEFFKFLSTCGIIFKVYVRLY